jgi:uncharacterized membrane protein (DUF373 family)
MKKAGKIIQTGIIYTLIVLMSGVIILATIELGYYLIKSVTESNFALINHDQLMDFFGVFMLVLIGIELLDTIKVYLKENVVHVEPYVAVATRDLTREAFAAAWPELKEEEFNGSFSVNSLFLLKHNGRNWDILEKFPFDA